MSFPSSPVIRSAQPSESGRLARLRARWLLGASLLLGAAAAADKSWGWWGQPALLVLAASFPLYLALFLWWAGALAARPGRVRRLSSYAAFLLINLLTAGCVVAFRAAADSTPLVVQARVNEAVALLEKGRPEEAYLVYAQIRSRSPRSFQVQMGLGAAAYQMGDYERAREHFARALKLAPDESRWRALNDLGQAQWKSGDARAALESYNRARSMQMPESELLEWHYRMGWAAFDAGRLEEAIEHYRWVAERGGKYSAASLYNIACAQAVQVSQASPQKQQALVAAAVENLRRAWSASAPGPERDALRRGVLGSPDERDPELEPLRDFPRFHRFLAELRSA